MLGGLASLGLGAIGLAAVGSLVWLAGLIVVTRGTKPSERPAILRAYGASQPRQLPRPRRLAPRRLAARPGRPRDLDQTGSDQMGSVDPRAGTG
jgi:hypothetical protein